MGRHARYECAQVRQGSIDAPLVADKFDFLFESGRGKGFLFKDFEIVVVELLAHGLGQFIAIFVLGIGFGARVRGHPGQMLDEVLAGYSVSVGKVGDKALAQALLGALLRPKGIPATLVAVSLSEGLVAEGAVAPDIECGGPVGVVFVNDGHGALRSCGG